MMVVRGNLLKRHIMSLGTRYLLGRRTCVSGRFAVVLQGADTFHFSSFPFL